LFFAVSRHLAFALAMLVVSGYCIVSQLASSNTIMQTILEPNKRGRVMSLFGMAFLGMAPIGSLLSGILADRIGTPMTIALSGAVIVTTPQAIALSDVRRSIGMFNEVRVPILGLVENMAGLDCPHCHQSIELFSGRGGDVLSKEYDVPLLGRIPFDPTVGTGGDRGIPISLSAPDSVQGKAFWRIAEAVVARVTDLSSQSQQPTIEVG
jgi:hypothetical protein